MDSLIAAASRALAAGDALGALKRVALRDDPPALALRGIAMAQLGEHPRARELLRRAARGFGTHEEMSRARCVVAEAEVALAMRDLGGSPRPLAAAAAALDARADRANALQARLIAARRLLLLGRLDETAAALAAALEPLDVHGLPPSLLAVAELATAELALRSMRIGPAQAALARAHEAAERARVPALQDEVGEARAAFDRPAARHLAAGHEQTLRLDEVAALLASNALVLDACRRGLRAGEAWLSLARRPVLFALARGLAEAWPGDVEREALIAQAFRTRHPDETHRARLRVEIGRLRKLVAPLAGIEATERGFVLRPREGRSVAVLVPPIAGDEASLVAVLADGAAWSTSALALALGESQRTVQRALADLEAACARSGGRAPSAGWHRRSPVSRRSCYSPLRCHSTRLPSPRRSRRMKTRSRAMSHTLENSRAEAPVRAAEIVREVRLEPGRVRRRLRVLHDRDRRPRAPARQRRDRRPGRPRARPARRDQGRVHGHGRAGAQPRRGARGDRPARHRRRHRSQAAGVLDGGRSPRLRAAAARPRQARAGPLAAQHRCGLARAPAAARKAIAPEELVAHGDAYARATGYPMQVQWTLLEGINDTAEEIEGLVRLLAGRHAVLNLIPYNAVDGLTLARPAAERSRTMARELHSRGILTKLRQSAGQDVQAGCGNSARGTSARAGLASRSSRPEPRRV